MAVVSKKKMLPDFRHEDMGLKKLVGSVCCCWEIIMLVTDSFLIFTYLLSSFCLLKLQRN